MTSAVCTLFEGDYHYGVGALVNSLYTKGYRGVVWAGYRGTLPPWGQPLSRTSSYEEFSVAPGCSIRFLPVETEAHFTNYKPQFMLDLWRDHVPEANSLFYFDPDITIKSDWPFFIDWIEGGVALCEDVSSPMPSSHPIRNAWRRFFKQRNVALPNHLDVYVNAGFLGLKREHAGLLETWRQFLAALTDDVGPISQMMVGTRLSPFYAPDQDLLNAALMACDVPLSLVSRNGMDFAPGGYIMSHSIGGAKPWRGRVLRRALSGLSPSMADKCYWSNVKAPISLYHPQALAIRKVALAAGSAIGRVLKRS